MTRQPFLWRILERVAPRVGATLSIEPSYKFVGLIRFANGRQSYFWENRLDLNPVAAARIARDKAYTSHFLRAQGISVPTEEAFFSEWLRTHVDPSRGPDAALVYARSLGYPVYVKPNQMSQGQLVREVHGDDELVLALEAVFAVDRVALVQRPCRGRDLRLVVLDDEVIDAYERVPLSVTGDGRSSVHELVLQRQAQYRQEGRDTTIPIEDPRLGVRLAKQGLARMDVLAPGRSIRLFDVSNLSVGGDSVPIPVDALHPTVVSLAVRVTSAMNLRFSGIDLFVEDPAAALGEYTVLEVNSAPGLDAYTRTGAANEAFVDDLYAKLLIALRDGPR
jgi:D-alanine-D-alanine ligase-like ATP-grasp enzyme